MRLMVWRHQPLSFRHPRPTGVLVNPSRPSMCLPLMVDLELAPPCSPLPASGCLVYAMPTFKKKKKKRVLFSKQKL